MFRQRSHDVQCPLNGVQLIPILPLDVHAGVGARNDARFRHPRHMCDVTPLLQTQALPLGLGARQRRPNVRSCTHGSTLRAKLLRAQAPLENGDNLFAARSDLWICE